MFCLCTLMENRVQKCLPVEFYQRVRQLFFQHLMLNYMQAKMCKCVELLRNKLKKSLQL